MTTLCPRKNYNSRQCTIEMSNPNASWSNCVCFIMNISATELPNFIRKYYLLHELLIFKYWRQNISVSNIALHTAVRQSGVQSTGHVRQCICQLIKHQTSSLQLCGQPADLNTVDYQIWWKLQDRVYRSQIRDVDQLKSRLFEEWEHFHQVVINKAVSQWRPRLRACVRLRAHCGHFEHRL